MYDNVSLTEHCYGYELVKTVMIIIVRERFGALLCVIGTKYYSKVWINI